MTLPHSSPASQHTRILTEACLAMVTRCRRLIPALLRYAEPGAPAEGRAAVLRYVEFAITQLGSTDRWVVRPG